MGSLIIFSMLPRIERDFNKALFISPKTVRSHTDNIYRKLKVHSKVEAARIALENGWF